MVTRTLLFAAAIALAIPATALGQSQPSSDWNGNFQFQNQGDRANALLQADLIERQENGYYGQWSQSYTGYHSYYTTNNVGSITSTNVEGDHNNINTDNINCGDVSGNINTGGDNDHQGTTGGGCEK